MGFPTSWPNGCPPADAKPAEGPAFRIVSNSPPTAADFLSCFELGTLPDAPPCRRVAVSIFQTREQARHRQRLSPRLGTHTARAVLNPEAGSTKLTDPRTGHLAWWAPEGFARESLFDEVESCH